jgi:hypothetical protein
MLSLVDFAQAQQTPEQFTKLVLGRNDNSPVLYPFTEGVRGKIHEVIAVIGNNYALFGNGFIQLLYVHCSISSSLSEAAGIYAATSKRARHGTVDALIQV